jgi:hypothetical protein
VIVGQYCFETETAYVTVGHCCLEAERAQDRYKIAAGLEVLMSYLVASAPQKEDPMYLPEWAFVGLQKCYGRGREDKSPPHPLGDMTRGQMPVSRAMISKSVKI